MCWLRGEGARAQGARGAPTRVPLHNRRLLLFSSAPPRPVTDETRQHPRFKHVRQTKVYLVYSNPKSTYIACQATKQPPVVMGYGCGAARIICHAVGFVRLGPCVGAMHETQTNTAAAESLNLGDGGSNRTPCLCNRDNSLCVARRPSARRPF